MRQTSLSRRCVLGGVLLLAAAEARGPRVAGGVAGEEAGAVALRRAPGAPLLVLDHLDPLPRQAVLVAHLQPADQLLADVAAQVEERRGVGGGHQHPDPDQPADGVGHLQHLGPPVPQLGVLEDRVELGAHGRDVDPPVDVELDGAEELGVAAGPVLERRLGEVRRRQHHPPVVPQPDHDVAQGDLLDPAPLVLHDDHVVEADRVAEGDLEAGDQVGQGRLRGDGGHDAQHPGRGQHARADRLHPGEAVERRAQGDEDDDGDGEPTDDQALGLHPSGDPVVGDVGAVAVQAEVLQEDQRRREQPGAGADREQPADQRDPVPPGVAHVLGPGVGDHRAERRRQHEQAERDPRPAHQRAGPDRPPGQQPDHDVDHDDEHERRPRERCPAWSGTASRTQPWPRQFHRPGPLAGRRIRCQPEATSSASVIR